MHPLSAWNYFRRNRQRALPLVAIIALAVFGVVLVVNLAETAMEDGRRDWISPSRIYSRVVARKDGLDPNLAARLRHHDAVDRVLPMLRRSIRKWGLMGSNASPVMGLREQDMAWFMAKTGLSVAEGRLPSGSRMEVALHDGILRNKGLQIGDRVGNDLDPMEWLPGEFTIVGRLQGPVQFGIVTEAAFRRIGVRSSELYVFPRPDRVAELDAYLTPLEGEDLAVETPTTMDRAWRQETGTVDGILMAINGVTIFVLSLAVGLLNTIYFLQRVGEYGVLAAIGYRVTYLIRRTLVEALTLTAIGWMLGIGLSYLGNWVVNRHFLGPLGLAVPPISLKAILFTVPIPVLISLFSVVTVTRRLTRMDPVSVVERRD